MIEHAIKIAKRSSTGKYAMGCVIVDQDHWKVVSNGWSHVPNIKKWRLYSLHAELHALIRLRRAMMPKVAIAYVAAVSRKSGNTTVARPCRDCALALYAAGVWQIVYTTPVGQQFMYLDEEFYEGQIDSFKVYNSPQY